MLVCGVFRLILLWKVARAEGRQGAKMSLLSESSFDRNKRSNLN